MGEEGEEGGEGEEGEGEAEDEAARIKSRAGLFENSTVGGLPVREKVKGFAQDRNDVVNKNKKAAWLNFI